MFSRAQPKRASREIGKIAPFAVPSKGMNVRDALALMDPSYAISLINVLPEQYGLQTRKGYVQWATDLTGGGAVYSLMVYYPADATPISLLSSRRLHAVPGMFASPRTSPESFGGKVFAAQGTDVFDVTAGGDGPWTADPDINSPGPFWTSQMFQNEAGSYLVACNNEGGYRYYDGTQWNVVTAGATPGQINGCDPDLFCYVVEWKRRLWFIEKNTTRAWYLPVDEITGTVSMFDFGPELAHGGELAAIANWTVDGGAGIDDHLVAVGRQGSVVIYQGTDPDTAATFQKKGTWQVGPLPAGRRVLTMHGGDVHILSQFGVVPVSKLLRVGGVEDSQIYVTALIDPLISRLMQDYSQQTGWQLVNIPKEQLGLIGVPYASALLGGDFLSLKYTTGGWSILRDTTYTCFANVDAIVYAGTQDGNVVLAFNGPLDNAEEGVAAGTPIRCEVMPAYQTIGTPGHMKRVLLFRPTFLATLSPEVSFAMAYNFGVPGEVLTPITPDMGSSVWDEDYWDSALWVGTQQPLSEWLGAVGEGFAATPQLAYLCGGSTILTTMELWTDEGGVLG